MFQKLHLSNAGQSVTAAPLVLLFFALGCGVCLSGCSAQSSHYESARVAQPADNPMNESLAVLAGSMDGTGDYTIGPEDLIEVTLFDIEDESGMPRVIPARVTNSGFVTLPYVGKVPAAGMDTLALENDLRRHYQHYIHNPEISVFVREYASYEISVLGYVENPGVVRLKGRRTLLEALGMAGGLNEDAGKSVRLSRAAENKVYTELIDLDRLVRAGDVQLNPVLMPGDVVNVPRAGVFYVEGMVNEPGAFPLTQQTTVTQAIATAGGPDITMSREGGTTLYRMRDDGTREPIPINIAKIRAGDQDDMLILEDDLIVVPVHGAKFVMNKIAGLFRVGVNAAY